jgi:hypothetical protein
MKYKLICSRETDIFSNVFSVIGAIDWCQINEMAPAARFDTGPYLDLERGPNWWEYYFERLSDIDPMCLAQLESDTESAAFALQMQNCIVANRDRVSDIIQHNVRSLPAVQEDVQTLWHRHVAGRFSVGLYIENEGDESGYASLVGDAVTRIEQVVRGRPCDTWRIVAVTGRNEVADLINEHFGGQVVCRNHVNGRFDDESMMDSSSLKAPALNVKGSSGYHAGLGALQDAYLLARCDVFLGSQSKLSTFVVACNPKVPWVQLSSPTSNAAAAGSVELVLKERAIQDLHKTAVERANLIERLHETAREQSLTIERLHQTLTKKQTADFEKRLKALEGRFHDISYRSKSWRDRFRPTLFDHRQYPPRTWRIPQHYTQRIAPMADAPTIAIVTPSFNHAPYIERTIRSVLDQNYPALRYTVQDGGSTDRTQAILGGFGKTVSWVSTGDNGQADAINRGFARIEGDIMGWLNSDDMLLPGSLDYVARFFKARPDVDVVYGHRVCIDEADKDIGRIILPRHDPETIKWMDYIPQETMFWRRRVWDKLGGVDPQFQYAMDWDFILRAHAEGFRFYRLPRFLGCFRVYDAQKTTSQIDVGNAESETLRLRYLGRATSPREHNDAVRAYVRRHVLTVRAYKLRLVRY